MKEIIRKKIQEIAEYLIDYEEEDDNFFSSDYGLIGVNIFLISYYKYSHEEKYKDKCQTDLERLVDKIGDSSIRKSNKQLLDFSRYLHELDNLGLLNVQSNTLLRLLDNHFIAEVDKYFAVNNYDVIGGALDISKYLLSRIHHNNDIAKFFESFPEKLTNISESNEQGIYWRSHLYEGNRIYLGLHGSASILQFLLSLIENGLNRSQCLLLLQNALHFLLAQNLGGQSNLYPQIVGHTCSRYSLEYVYGDLYIGYVLYLCAHYLGDDRIYQHSDEVFARSIDHLISLDSNSKFIRDSGIAYGIEGAHSVYSEMYYHTKKEEFKEAMEICMKYSLERLDLDQNLEYLGYRPNIVAHIPGSYLGLINGLAGIGCTYISHCDSNVRLYKNFIYLS